MKTQIKQYLIFIYREPEGRKLAIATPMQGWHVR